MWQEYLATGATPSVVADGVAVTARVMTSAAIMAAVFLSFVLSDRRVFKLLGLGLAKAVIIDATVARMVLVLAVRQLLGRINRWTSWLQRGSPQVAVDPVPLSRATD
jgi:RND superfamily putative drug exporter